MLISKELQEIIERVQKLTPQEQSYLMSQLEPLTELQDPLTRPRRKWGEIMGTAPYPLAGEDAQQWVSREREAWGRREQNLREQQ